MNEKNAFWEAWGPWITGGGFLAFVTLLLSYIARPSSQTIADLTLRCDKLEEARTKDKEELKREHSTVIGQLRQEHAGEIATMRAEFSEARREIGSLRESNFHMRVVFTALSVQYNLVRQELLDRDPNSKILTIKEIVDESHVPLQSVTMFDPASVGFLWPGRTPPPGGPPAGHPPPATPNTAPHP